MSLGKQNNWNLKEVEEGTEEKQIKMAICQNN